MSELSSGNQDVAAHLQGCGRLGLRSGVGGWGRGQGWEHRSEGAGGWGRGWVWEHMSEGAEAGVEVRCGSTRWRARRLGSRSGVVGPDPPVAFAHRAGGCPLPGPPMAFPLEGSLPCPFFLLKGSCWVGPHPLTPLTLLKARPLNTVKLAGGDFTLQISGTQLVHSTLYPHC